MITIHEVEIRVIGALDVAEGAGEAVIEALEKAGFEVVECSRVVENRRPEDGKGRVYVTALWSRDEEPNERKFDYSADVSTGGQSK